MPTMLSASPLAQTHPLMRRGMVVRYMLMVCILLPSAGLAEAEAAFLAPMSLTTQSCSRGLSCSRVCRRAMPIARLARPAVMMMQEAASEEDGGVAPAVPEASDNGEEGAGSLSRKERRRSNRKSRNNSRNRIAAPTGSEGSIRRSEALSQHFLTDEGVIMRLVEQVQVLLA